MRISAFALSAAAVLSLAGAAFAGDPDSCKTVKFSDVGWTDITATTSITAEILKGLGYTPKITVLSVPVTYASMKNKDIDVFLGNWQPSMENDRKPYIEDKSVVEIGANLPVGAKYTLAVPQYTYDKGLKDFADIAKYKDSLKGKIFGIEPGNDGNRLILDLIKGGKFSLKDFQLVESSEQGMLAEVQRATSHKEDVVFLGWAPHPMNVNFKIQYLTRRRRQLRAEFRRCDRLHQRARRLRRRVPERRQARQEHDLHRRYRERSDEQDPDRRQGRPGRSEGMAEDQPQGTRRLAGRRHNL